MGKDIDDVLNDIASELSNQTKPKVRYNPKTKRISVTYEFDLGEIPKLKIIASREKWIELFFELDFDQLIYDDIEPYLYRPSKVNKDALKRHAKEHPQLFCSDILDCFLSVLCENPLFSPARKPRKPPKFDWHQKNIISAQAAHLYVYLTHACKEPESPL